MTRDFKGSSWYIEFKGKETLMEKFTYHAPTEIVFGKGAETRAAEFVTKYGGTRAVLIYGGQSAVKSGLIARLEEGLRAGGIEVLSLGGVVPNPLVSTAREMARKAIEFKADFVLAAGGGSVIDTAKGVAHAAGDPSHDIWEYWTGTPIVKSLPVGAVLTISAAGSETSDSAVLTNDTITPPIKKGVNTVFNRCRFALMNPELTMSLPKYQIGAGAADIFMHTSERYFSPVLGNHLSDEIAEGLFRDIIHYGPIGVKHPDNYEAMSEIMWCGSISHVGITGLGGLGDWACHQLGMAMSAIYDSTHGATLTAVWPSWCRYVMGENVARFANFARKVYGIHEGDDDLAAEKGIDKTVDFFRSLGMPVSLEELLGHAVTDEEIEHMADVCSWGNTRTIGSFRKLDREDMAEIYRMSRTV